MVVILCKQVIGKINGCIKAFAYNFSIIIDLNQ